MLDGFLPNLSSDRGTPDEAIRAFAGIDLLFVARQGSFNSAHTTRNEFETMRLRSTLFELDGKDK
jgi:hypothetical protein